MSLHTSDDQALGRETENMTEESLSKKRNVSDIYTSEERTSTSKGKNPTPAEANEESYDIVSKEEAIAEQKKAGMGLGDYTMVNKEPETKWSESDRQFLFGDFEEVEAPEKKNAEDKKKGDGKKD